MNISRRKLYAAGECFGECATRREPGRIVCGGGDSSSEQQQQDRKVAVQGGVGVSGDGNRVVNLTSDFGAIAAGTAVAARALDSVGQTTSRALDSVDKSTALVAGSYDGLLSAADKLFQRGETLIGQTQQYVSDAYHDAATDAKGTIDNKTIVALAVAGVVAAAGVAYAARKG